MAHKDSAMGKVLVVGDVATGKTSFIQRFCRGHFSPNHNTTIGVDFALKIVNINNENLKMQLWDIAGQERFSGLTRAYYQGAVAAFVLYDIGQRQTFENVKRWREDVAQKVMLPNGDAIPVFLIGNKCDLPDSERQVASAEGQQLAKSLNFQGFYETSAMKDVGITEACTHLANVILDNNKRVRSQVQPQPAVAQNNDTVKLGNQGGAAPKADDGGCC